MRYRKVVKTMDVHPNRPFYEYQTRSDSNGPVNMIAVEQRIIDGTTISNGKMFREVKPYFSFVSNGLVGDGTLLSDVRDQNGDFLPLDNSMLLASVASWSPDSFAQLSAEFDETAAINGAISSSLKYGDLLLLVTAAEAKKTANMVATVFKRFYNFILSLYKAAKKLNVAQAYDVISDAWLEARYGWRPLFFELQGLYKFFIDNDVFQIRSAYGNVLHKPNAQFECPSFLGTSNGIVECNNKVLVTEISHRAGFNYGNSIKSRNEDNLSVLGLDLQSLASTTYDLVPFSFVLDMFVNMGEYIKTLDWESNVSHFNGYITTRYALEIETTSKTSSGGVTNSGYVWEYPEDFVNDVDRAHDRVIYDWLKSVGVASRTWKGFDVHRPYWLDVVTQSDIEKYCVKGITIPGTDTVLDPDAYSQSIKPEYFRSSHRMLPPFLVPRLYRFTDASGSTTDRNGKEYGSVIRKVAIPVPPEVLALLDRSRNYEYNVEVAKATAAINAHVVDGILIRPAEYDRLRNDNYFVRALQFAAGTHNWVRWSGPLLPASKGPGSQHWENYVVGTDYPHGSVIPFDISPQYYDSNRRWSPDSNKCYHSVAGITKDTTFGVKLSLEPPSFTKNVAKGEYITRSFHNEFNFKLLAELDLNWSQMTDLAIFAERLVTVLRKK